MKRLFFVFAVGAALCGCQRSGFDPEPTPVKGLLLTSSETSYQEWFTAGDDLLRAPASRATESNFQALDSIGVFIYSGALGAGPYHSTNMIYYTKDGTPDGSTSPQWTAATAMGGALVAGTAYSSTAYYPYQKTATNASAVVHSVATDQRAAAVTGSAQAVERSDFMWAPPVVVSNPATAPQAKMVFEHLLTKLVVSLQVPSMIDGVAVSKLNSVAIKNLHTTASIHLGTGALSGLTNVQDIKPRQLSGNGNAGTVSVYEAVVISQTAASGVVLVEVRCQTASGERVANYFPAASGLVLGSGKKITLTLTSAADIAITSELDLVTGQAYSDLPLKLKVASGTAWTLTAPAGSWITLASTSGGTYGAALSGTGTGGDQTVYVRATANTGVGATPRQAVLTLAAKIAGVDRSVTYTAVQNYSQPVVGFPTTNLIMEALNAQLPAVVGNSNWYIKAVSLPQGVRLSRRNVLFSELTASDTIALHSLSNTGTKEGYMVSGNYYNSNGGLYIVTDLNTTPNVASFTCNGVAVTIDARSIKINNLRWARGNLIASNSTAGAHGLGGCRIGNPADGGLYFQFGSLIGYKGGDQVNGGTGAGMPKAPLTTNGTYWNGVEYSWVSDAMVWPTGMVGTKTKWELTVGPNIATLSDYYFNYSVAPWDTENKNIREFNVSIAGDSGLGSLASGRYATKGVGDPCSYYLGSSWRLPTAAECKTLFDDVANNTKWANVLHWKWTTQGVAYFVSTSDLSSSPKLFFPASGNRYYLDGSFYYVTWDGRGWSSSVSSAAYGLYLYFDGGVARPYNNYYRSYGFPVRCVMD